MRVVRGLPADIVRHGGSSASTTLTTQAAEEHQNTEITEVTENLRLKSLGFSVASVTSVVRRSFHRYVRLKAYSTQRRTPPKGLLSPQSFRRCCLHHGGAEVFQRHL
jgi:hypothetical protein